ncbi:Lead, cadmium, zinc and mercury transporting ATPase [Fimbriiglobus ruber]|uniref:Lead, cadmium, zinc and mercury transporting ATPase n=2 Tax=Fimbriiglobus ruber TaxID=1908690 RepID=A0A225E1M9_9BACT|nr:Lead, cadmium, zinc and mercury transporting ATPase [Fimbriiglobus ruber]
MVRCRKPLSATLARPLGLLQLEDRTTPANFALGIGGTGSDQANAIATDAAGDSYVVGTYQQAVNFGGSTLTATAATDGFVAKYSPSGVLQWAKDLGGTTATAVAVDGSGAAYVAGFFTGSVTVGTVNLTAGGNTHTFVTKLNSVGAFVYSAQVVGTSTDFEHGIAVDGSGDAYVTGYYDGTPVFGANSLSNSSVDEMYVAELNPAGVFTRAMQATGAGTSRGIGVGVDVVGNTYVTGYFSGSQTFGSTTLSGGAPAEMFVAKLNSAWTFTYATQTIGNNAVVQNIAVDPAGDAYVTGAFIGTVTFGTAALSAGTSSNVFVAKLNPTGTFVYATQASGTSNYGQDIAIDTAGDAYLTGYFAGTGTFGATSLSAGTFDAFVAELSPSGNFVSAVQATGTDNLGTGIALDSSGDAYVTGYFYGTMTVGGVGLTSVDNVDTRDIFLAELVAPPPVIPPALSASFDGSGDLVIADTVGVNDNMTAVAVGTNLVVTDANAQFIAAPAGSTLSNQNQTLTIPFASIGGPQIIIDLGAGNDTLTVDETGGPIPETVLYDGGTGTKNGLVVKGTTGQTATYLPDAAAKGKGTVTTSAGTVSFQNLTPVDITGFSTASMTFPNAVNAVTVANGFDYMSGDVHPALDITGTSGGIGFESVAFWNDTSVVIDTTSVPGTDSVNISGANYANGITNFTVQEPTTQSGTVTVNGVISFPGAVTLTAGQSIAVNANITGGAGGGTTLYAGGHAALNTTGVSVTGAAVTATGSNPVSVTGIGGSGAGVANRGVYLSKGGVITSGGGGTVTVLGMGGAGTGRFDDGIEVDATSGASEITSGGGNVSVTGYGGGAGTSGNNRGILLNGPATISSGGGPVTLQGYGGTGTGGANIGILDQAGGQITSGGGTVTVTGIGGNDANGGDHGIALINASDVVTSGGGNVIVSGYGGGTGASASSYGIDITAGQIAATGNGTVTVLGVGGAGTGGNNLGLETDAGSIVSPDTTLNLTGNAGENSSIGMIIDSTAGTAISAGSGNILLTSNATILESATAGVSSTGTLTVITGNGANLAGANTISSFDVTNTGSINVSLSNTAATLTVTGISQPSVATITIHNTGALVFPNALDGNYNLVDTSTGPTTFAAVGSSTALANLSVSGMSVFNGGSISTTGNQTFSGPVTFGTATVLTSTGGGSIIFGGTVDGGYDLTTVTTGFTRFVGAVGGTTAPTNLNITTATLLATAITTFVSLSVTNSGAASISGPITGPTAALVKGGAGTLTISGTNTFGGTTTVNAGTLLVNGVDASSPVLVASGILEGSGTVGPVTVAAATVAPGTTTTGILNTGSLTFSNSSSLLNARINSATPGTGYDQINATGTVNLAGVTLTTSGTIVSHPGQSIDLIATDGTDPVTGTFAGLAEGSTVTVNGVNFVISYQSGSGGNDVTLIQPGPWAITRFITVLGGSNVTLRRNGNYLQEIQGNTVLDSRPLATVTGITYTDTAGDVNTLTVDYSGGFFTPGVTYIGNGAGNGIVGENLVVTGGTFNTVTDTFTTTGPGETGTLLYDPTGTGTTTDLITYSGLSGLTPVDQTGSAIGNLVFNLPTTSNTAFLEDDGTPNNGYSRIRSGNSKFETTTFANPATSFTVNAGTATDTLTVNATPDLTSSVALGTASNPFASLTVAGAVALASGSNFTSFGTTTTINAALSTAGAGAVSLTAGQNIVVKANVTGGSGGTTLLATGSAALNTVGVTVQNAAVVSAMGTGAVSVNGTGGTGTGIHDYGVFLDGTNGASAISSGGGNVSVIGQGGGSGASGGDYGVYVYKSGSITSGGSGTVTVQGTGGNGSSTSNIGVQIDSGGRITSGGSGAVTVTGIGGSGSGVSNSGLVINTATSQITSGGGNVSVTGTGGSSSTSTGVLVVGGQITAAGNGTVTVVGTGGGGAGGIGVTTQGGSIISPNSALSVTGNSGANYLIGIDLIGSGVVLSGGTAGINLTSSNGQIDDGGSAIVSTSGTLTTTSNEGTILSGPNTVAAFNGTDTGNNLISLTNVATVLTVTGLSPGTGQVTINNTGSVVFPGPVDGSYSLTVTSTGQTTFAAAVGGVTPLTTVSVSGAVAINGGSVTTTLGQTYNDAATLGTNTTLTNTGTGLIQFGATLDGGYDLTAQTGGQAAFAGAIGGTTPIAALTVTTATLTAAGIATTDGITITNSGAGIISGPISGAPAPFVKNGGGSLTLSGINTFGGQTTISGGYLIVNGTDLSSPVSVINGALGGSGTVANVTVTNTGGIDPGALFLQSIIGTLNTGSVTFGNDDTGFGALINGTVPGSSFDQLNVTGTVNLGQASFGISGAITSNPGQVIDLIANDGTDAVNGTFNGLAEGGTVTVNGVNFVLSYQGGPGGNDVTLTQPGIWAIAAPGGGANVTLRLSGAYLQELLGGTVLDSRLLATVTGVTYTDTTTTADTLTVDYSGGFFTQGVTYAGNGVAGEKLVVTGGTFNTVTDTFTTTGPGKSGTILNDPTGTGTTTDLITYSGLTPVNQTGTTVGNLILNLPTTTTATLEAAGAGTDDIRNTGGTPFETTTFSNPTTTLTVNAAGSNTLRLAAMDVGFAPVTVTLTGSATDTFQFANAGAVAASTSLTLTTANLDLNGTSPTVNGLSGTGTILNSGVAGTLTTTGGGSFGGDIIAATTGLTVAGTSRILTLTGTNNYGGSTTIDSGNTLQAGATGATSSASPLVDNGTLDLGGFDSSVGTLTGTGTVLNSGALATLTVTGGGTFGGTITGAATALAVDGNGQTLYFTRPGVTHCPTSGICGSSGSPVSLGVSSADPPSNGRWPPGTS